jgi:hypothetical protein
MKNLPRRNPMVTLDVRFRCETCKTEIMNELRIGPNFFIGADQFPEGWKFHVEEYGLKVWCPLHTNDAK